MCKGGAEFTLTYHFDKAVRLFSQHQLVQIPLHNHVLHTLHGLIKESRVGCVRVVDVHLLAWLTDEMLEFLCEEVLACFDVSVVSLEVWEVLADGCFAGLNLLAEDVHLVEEDDNCGFLEVPAVRYALEEHESLVHLVLGNISLALSPC